MKVSLFFKRSEGGEEGENKDICSKFDMTTFFISEIQIKQIQLINGK